MVASAVRIDLTDKRELDATHRRLMNDTWQEDAWEYYDFIGEIKYTATLLSNVLSRVRIYPAFVTDISSVPSSLVSIPDFDKHTVETSAEAIRTLTSGNGGMSGLLRNASLNLFIAGECYLIKEPARLSKNLPEKWSIRSVSEIVVGNVGKGKKTAMQIRSRRDTPATEWIPIPEGSFVGRLWRSHPRYTEEADSSIRGVLELLDELLLANRQARINTKSRMHAGILGIPDDIDNAYQSDGDLDETSDNMADMSDDASQSFQDELLHALTAPIKDEADASSIVPLILRGSKEAIAAIKYITLDRSIDPLLLQRAEAVMNRVLAGLDIPKDVVNGLAAVKYSNAVMIEESLYKAHVEPLVLMIVDQLTEVFYRPYLVASGVDPEIASRCVLWYDPSAITTRTNKADAALELYNANAISEAALRRAHGFPESDAPTQNEKAWRLSAKQGLISEPIMEALIKYNIPDLFSMARQNELQNTDPSTQGDLSKALGGDAPPAASSDIITPDASTPASKPTPPAPTDLVEP